MSLKKKREEHQQFVVEGVKIVDEVLNSDFLLDSIFALESWFTDERNAKIQGRGARVYPLKRQDLERVSNLKTPNQVLAIVHYPDYQKRKLKDGKWIVLDQVKDPGNLGTIVRTADWFGFEGVLCSKDSVDCFNNKVVQSAMGSIFRTPVIYSELKPELTDLKARGFDIVGAFLEGDDYRKLSVNSNVALVMGSESHGVSKEIEEMITHKVFIPGKGKAESLNVGVATGILSAVIGQ